jgi:hypothetical protein
MPTNKKELTPEEKKRLALTNAYDLLSDGSELRLTVGNQGKRVKALQLILEMPEDLQKGVFGTATQLAVSEWQEKNGLTKTGNISLPDSVAKLQIMAINWRISGSAMDEESAYGAEDLEKAVGIEDLDEKYGNTGAPSPGDNLFQTGNLYFEDLGARVGATKQEIVPEPMVNDEASAKTSASTATSKVQSSNIAEGLAEKPTPKPAMKAAETIQPKQIEQSTPSFDMMALNNMFGLNSTPSEKSSEPFDLLSVLGIGQPATPPQVAAVNSAEVAAANAAYISASSVVNESSKITSNVDNTLYNNYTKAINSQASAADQINNINNLTNPQTINQITNNTAQIQQNTQELASIVAEPAARVETNELISTNTVNQIVKPANPVVTSVEMMGAQVSNSIQNLGADLSSSVSNIKSGDQISSSNVTQVDQSSIYNIPGQEPQKIMEASNNEASAETPTKPMNDVMLSAIYELLAAGIKVKIAY